MTSKQFYKSTLPILPPIGLSIMALVGIYSIGREHDFSLLIIYLIFSVSLIIAIELVLSFFCTLILLIQKKKNNGIFRLNLLILPYLPPVSVTAIFYAFYKLTSSTIANYRLVLLIIYASTGALIYLCCVFLNLKLNLFEKLE